MIFAAQSNTSTTNPLNNNQNPPVVPRFPLHQQQPPLSANTVETTTNAPYSDSCALPPLTTSSSSTPLLPPQSEAFSQKKTVSTHQKPSTTMSTTVAASSNTTTSSSGTSSFSIQDLLFIGRTTAPPSQTAPTTSTSIATSNSLSSTVSTAGARALGFPLLFAATTSVDDTNMNVNNDGESGTGWKESSKRETALAEEHLQNGNQNKQLIETINFPIPSSTSSRFLLENFLVQQQTLWRQQMLAHQQKKPATTAVDDGNDTVTKTPVVLDHEHLINNNNNHRKSRQRSSPDTSEQRNNQSSLLNLAHSVGTDVDKKVDEEKQGENLNGNGVSDSVKNPRKRSHEENGDYWSTESPDKQQQMSSSSPVTFQKQHHGQSQNPFDHLLLGRVGVHHYFPSSAEQQQQAIAHLNPHFPSFQSLMKPNSKAVTNVVSENQQKQKRHFSPSSSSSCSASSTGNNKSRINNNSEGTGRQHQNPQSAQPSINKVFKHEEVSMSSSPPTSSMAPSSLLNNNFQLFSCLQSSINATKEQSSLASLHTTTFPAFSTTPWFPFIGNSHQKNTSSNTDGKQNGAGALPTAATTSSASSISPFLTSSPSSNHVVGVATGARSPARSTDQTLVPAPDATTAAANTASTAAAAASAMMLAAAGAWMGAAMPKGVPSEGPINSSSALNDFLLAQQFLLQQQLLQHQQTQQQNFTHGNAEVAAMIDSSVTLERLFCLQQQHMTTAASTMQQKQRHSQEDSTGVDGTTDNLGETLEPRNTEGGYSTGSTVSAKTIAQDAAAPAVIMKQHIVVKNEKQQSYDNNVMVSHLQPPTFHVEQQRLQPRHLFSEHRRRASYYPLLQQINFMANGSREMSDEDTGTGCSEMLQRDTHSPDSIRRKKSRTVFTRLQITQLETWFDEHKYLSSTQRSQLARELRLSETQVKIWFQNRRNKCKRISGGFGWDGPDPVSNVLSQAAANYAASNATVMASAAIPQNVLPHQQHSGQSPRLPTTSGADGAETTEMTQHRQQPLHQPAFLLPPFSGLFALPSSSPHSAAATTELPEDPKQLQQQEQQQLLNNGNLNAKVNSLLLLQKHLVAAIGQKETATAFQFPPPPPPFPPASVADFSSGISAASERQLQMQMLATAFQQQHQAQIFPTHQLFQQQQNGTVKKGIEKEEEEENAAHNADKDKSPDCNR